MPQVSMMQLRLRTPNSLLFRQLTDAKGFVFYDIYSFKSK